MATFERGHRDRDDLRRFRLFYREPFFWYAGCYEFSPDCPYVPVSPKQQALAQERIDAYLAAIQHQGLRPAGRYLAVETSRLPEGSRCVMVYDTFSAHLAVRGYAVRGLPPAGSTVHLGSVRARLIA